MANQLIDGDQAIVAKCITAATMLAPAQGRADFILYALSANYPATVHQKEDDRGLLLALRENKRTSGRRPGRCAPPVGGTVGF
jgi:hypothetical protein